MTFHNGEPFDAEAVRFSLLRAAQAYGATAWFPEIAQVDVPAPYTVNVLLRAPDSLFLYRLGHIGLVLPPRYFRQVGQTAFGENPAGTGRFRFVRWDSVGLASPVSGVACSPRRARQPCSIRRTSDS